MTPPNAIPTEPDFEVLAPVAAEGQRALVTDWLQWFEDQVAKGLRGPLTVQKYRQVIVYWIDFLESQARTDQPTPGTLDRYQMALMARGLKPSTINLYLEAVRSLYAWAERKDRYPNCARSLEILRVRRDAPLAAFTEQEVQGLLNVRAGTDLASLRDRLLIAMLFGTAMRGASLVGCDVGDFDPTTRTIHFRTKGSRTASSVRTVPEGTAVRLQEFLVRRRELGPLQPADPLFPALDRAHYGHRLTTRSLRHLLATAAEQLPQPSRARGVHALRRAALVKTADALGIEAAQEAAGHASLATTRANYVGIQKDQIHRQVAELLNGLRV